MSAISAILLALLLAAPAEEELPKGDAVMDKVSEVLSGMKDLAVDVEVHTPAVQASGTIVLQYTKRKSADPARPAETIQKSIVRTQAMTPRGMAAVKKLIDGEHEWIEYRFRDSGDVRVIRRKVDESAPRDLFQADWHDYLRKVRESYDFRTLRSDTFDETPVWVVEGTLREKTDDKPEESSDSKLPKEMTIHVAKSDHFPRKFEARMKKPEGEGEAAPDVSVRFSRVHLNKGLNPDTFRYTIPEGAEFIDVK